jgi:hypothetical protein
VETLNITETRIKLSHIVNNQLSVQIGISKHKSVIMPKSLFDTMQERISTLEKANRDLEIKLITLESEEHLKSNQKRFIVEEVDAMIAKLRI